MPAAVACASTERWPRTSGTWSPASLWSQPNLRTACNLIDSHQRIKSNRSRCNSWCQVVYLTRCISHVFGVPKSNGHSNAEDHEQPIDLRNVYLAMNFLRCVYNFYSRKAAQGLALIDDWECSADDRLTSNYRSQDCQYEHWPSDLICSYYQRELHMNSTGIEFIADKKWLEEYQSSVTSYEVYNGSIMDVYA